MMNEPRRILIIKPSSLGDVITAIPILRGLRRAFPDAHISWMLATGCAAIMEHDSDLDEVILFDRRELGKAWRSPRALRSLHKFLAHLAAEHFDWVIDLQGLFRSGFFAWASKAKLRAGFADAREFAELFYTHRIKVSPLHTVDRNIALLAALGVEAQGKDMTLQVSPTAADFAGKLGKLEKLEKFLVCVPPTRWATKQYPVRHWRAVISNLSEKISIVVLGSPDDVDLCSAVCRDMPNGVINLAGQTDVAQMVGVIAASAGVICSDSAAKFIAPAVGIDTIILIGPTQVERTGPYLKGTAVLAPVPCRGCLKRTCRHMTCMQMIDPKTVISAAEKMLDQRGN